MVEGAMAMIALLAATGSAAQQPAPPIDRARPAPDVYYPPLPPAPVQPAETPPAGTAPGAAHASPSKGGCRSVSS